MPLLLLSITMKCILSCKNDCVRLDLNDLLRNCVRNMISLRKIEIEKTKKTSKEVLSYLSTPFKIQLKSNSLATNDHLSHSHSPNGQNSHNNAVFVK